MWTLFRWCGAVVFFVSLLSFAFVYNVRLSVPAQPDGTTVPDSITNVILFSIFAMHHSVMARTGVKTWLTRQLPTNLERSLYVWIASVLFLAVCWWWKPLPGLVWSLPGAAVPLYLAQVMGVVLTIAAARMVGVWELAGVKQPDSTRPVEFSATGPFALVRHPIYLGWILIVFPLPVMTTSQLLFAVTSSLYLVVAIPFEEASLVQTYGEKYAAYQRQMRWKLIPYVW